MIHGPRITSLEQKGRLESIDERTDRLEFFLVQQFHSFFRRDLWISTDKRNIHWIDFEKRSKEERTSVSTSVEKHVQGKGEK